MQVTLNDIVYDISITFRNTELSLEAPTDNIIEFTIVNDMMSCFPRATLKLKDMYNQNFIKFIADGDTYIDVVGQAKLYDGENTKLMEFSHSFMLENEIPLDFNKDVSTIQYEFSSTHREVWLKPIKYSTVNIFKSPTEIIYNLITEAGLNINPAYIDSEKKLRYTSTASDSLGEQISYLLSEASAPDSGVYYVYYSLIDNELQIFSSNEIKNKKIKGINSITIPTSISDSNPFTTPEAIYSGHDMGAMQRKLYANGSREYIFDYENRNFLMTDITNEHIGAALLLKGDTSYINELSSSDQIQIQNIPDKKWGIQSRKIFKNIDNLRIQLIGLIDRDIGQVIRINSDADEVNTRYAGDWLVFQIHNHYIPGSSTFKQSLYLVRTDRKNG